jgi:hypothetical protein
MRKQVLTERLKLALDKCILTEQLGFMSGKLMVEGNRLIDLLTDYVEANDKTGIIAGVDFAKAFNSISHQYIMKLLRNLHFPDYFMDAIATLYAKPEAAVINNSVMTKYFFVGRGCRQGDPIAPYLFILAIEPLLQQIKHDQEIVGLLTPTRTVKLTAYADDITLLVRDQASRDKALEIIDDFGRISGLLLNRDKTEIMHLRSDEEGQKDTIKVTGVVHGSIGKKRIAEKENFDPVISALQNAVNTWKMHGLTLTGRAMVAKSQGWALFQHISMAVKVPTWVAKKIDDIIFKFVWKGTDRVKRIAIALNDDRSLKLLESSTINIVNQLQWLSRSARPSNAWVDFLTDLQVKRILHKGSKAKAYYKPNKDLPLFHMNIITALQELQEVFNPNKMRENSSLEGNYIFRDKDRKMLKLPQLRKGGKKTAANVIADDGKMSSKPANCATNLALAMEWEAIRKYVWPTFQILCYESKSNLAIVRSKSTLVLGRKALMKNVLNCKKIVQAIRHCPPPLPPRWNKAKEMLGSTKIISHTRMKKWAVDNRTKDFVFRSLCSKRPLALWNKGQPHMYWL